ncbi:hypothetical protein [Hymenobacter cellulosilyticus]|uniref:STAS/SEC14 domain-containing protein n=1 Tax=Hymenobacter cellulosilyticus TaxID=2932248 RepID=A0A8T9QH42_9BACT|nr:hypothetical protein [Hymenobacter cellulosilyticus]UOQ74899.1 hypothetical protein MUN79_14140 [Hymenobacter cellulosilyticus]
MPVLASHPALVLHLHQGTHNALETEWLGYVSSADFRRYITEAIALAREHHATAWIANDRLLGAVRPKDLTWIGQTVLPALVELGVVRFARLEAEQTLNRMLIGNLYQDTTPGLPFQTRMFTDVDEARTWALS